MTAAELFVACLEAEGVDTVFALPGEENAHVMLALHDSSIRVVLTRHEQGAAFMADVYGRLTGRPGVCLGTLGPGAANLVTGVANGNMDRSPMIVITGQADSRRLHKESHQAMDVVSMFRPLTKWATPVIHPDNIPEVVRKAFKLAMLEKPGACHIELSEDVAAMPSAGAPLCPQRLRRPTPNERAVDDAFELIRTAERPVMLAGNGAIRTRASRQLRRFAESTGIGVISTFMGKGSVGRGEPYCLFTIGLQAKDRVACAIDAADVVITLGYDMVEYPPRLWNSRADKTIVHMDFLPAEVDAHYHATVEVVGDLADGLAMLNQRLEREPIRLDLTQHHTIRRQMNEEFEAFADDRTIGSIRPQKVLFDVRRALGERDILISDVGAHKMWIARYYQCDEPNTCLIPNGFCAMGFAVPGAIAAGLVHPDRRVLAIAGDGGFLMNVQELETARRLNVNVVFMVWVDGAYGLISWKQDTAFGRHTQLKFGNPDFVKLAESFGCLGLWVDRSEALSGALEQAFAYTGPSVLALPIDYRENALLTERLGNIACPI